MSTLTLTFDDDFVAQARAYAQRTGTDLTVLFRDAVQPIIARPAAEKPLPPELAALYGCISLPPSPDSAVSSTEAGQPTVARQRKHRPLSPEVEALCGCISLPPDFDYKQALGEILAEKYL